MCAHPAFLTPTAARVAALHYTTAEWLCKLFGVNYDAVVACTCLIPPVTPEQVILRAVGGGMLDIEDGQLLISAFDNER